LDIQFSSQVDEFAKTKIKEQVIQAGKLFDNWQENKEIDLI